MVYSEGNGTIKQSFPTISPAQAPQMGDVARLRLHFLTPTRLKFTGNLCEKPHFHVIVRNLLRRLSSLLYFHCGQSLSLDFRGVIQRAEAVETTQDETRWHDWERYSSRQDTRMTLGGFVGAATYAGSLGEFLPFLWIGQYTHVGKGATFGLGHYEIGVLKD